MAIKRSSKLQKAVVGLNKELAKLEKSDPKAKAAIQGHLTAIHDEVQTALGGVTGVQQTPGNWID